MPEVNRFALLLLLGTATLAFVILLIFLKYLSELRARRPHQAASPAADPQAPAEQLLSALPEISSLRDRLKLNQQAAHASGDPLWQFDAQSVLEHELPTTVE